MSWVIKASPKLAIFDPLMTQKMIAVIDDGDWLYAVWPEDTAPPMRKMYEEIGDSEGVFYIKSGTLPREVADRLAAYHRGEEAGGIGDGYDAGMEWRRHVSDPKILDIWERYFNEDEDEE